MRFNRQSSGLPCPCCDHPDCICPADVGGIPTIVATGTTCPVTLYVKVKGLDGADITGDCACIQVCFPITWCGMTWRTADCSSGMEPLGVNAVLDCHENTGLGTVTYTLTIGWNGLGTCDSFRGAIFIATVACGVCPTDADFVKYSAICNNDFAFDLSVTVSESGCE